MREHPAQRRAAVRGVGPLDGKVGCDNRRGSVAGDVGHGAGKSLRRGAECWQMNTRMSHAYRERSQTRFGLAGGCPFGTDRGDWRRYFLIVKCILMDSTIRSRSLR